MKASAGLKAVALLQCSTGYELTPLASQHANHSYAASPQLAPARNTPGKCTHGFASATFCFITPAFPKEQPASKCMFKGRLLRLSPK